MLNLKKYIKIILKHLRRETMIKAIKNYMTIKKLTPVRAIRAKCLDCTCGQTIEIRECTIKTCPLYLYRLGKRPTLEQIDEQNKLIKKS